MATAEEIMRHAQEINAAREVALAPLAGLVADRKTLRDEFEKTEEPYGRAYVAAQVAGWTAEELKGLGAEEPKRRPKGRPRTTNKTTTPKNSAPATAEAVPKNASASDATSPGKLLQ
ncbi:hypothetical protein M1P56_35320 (plasmid) [Streptomyces sp. HU2014]|uniref:hypothetical protein n=1 Tax=Streptomyces sp. HU2014 TaxID=2939414 RepID=UPI00200F0670|nr:hypothetical protein [Streptomyces sp. HU2014]UQI49664.1 hypothetical protein M1P56_35320 [Streptomyces sp. HU2014]